MRINFKYGAAVGVLAAAVGMIGPMAVHAGQAPGTSVPNRAGAISVQAPAIHISGITGRPVVLTSMIERPAWQHETAIAQRENKGLASSRGQFGLPGLQDRKLLPRSGCASHGSDRCGYGNGCGWNRYGYGNGCGYGYGNGCGYGYGYGNGCGYRYGYGNGCGGNRYGYGGGCGYGYGNGYGNGCGYRC